LPTPPDSSLPDPVPPRLSRLLPLLGPAALERLRAARVVVAGLGGVGSWAAEALARSGVGALVLADPDRVSEPDLNRQLFASLDELGEPKAEAAARRLARVAPGTTVRPLSLFVDGSTVSRLLDPPPDVFVDAVDSLDAKAEMIAACVSRGVPVVSSMGAARLLDASAVRAADISETRGCPLARNLRRKLRALGVTRGVRAVFSDSPRLPSAAGTDLGSAVWVTAVFGFTIAGECVRMLAEP